MRALHVMGTALGVSAEQEERWYVLAASALRDVKEGRQPHARVSFKTDMRVFGSIPISPTVPITFADEEAPAKYLGAITALGQDAKTARPHPDAAG